MYEDKTVDSIHSDMLSNIDNSYEKSVGYPTYDFTRSFAIQEKALYTAIDNALSKVYVSNLSGDELTQRVKEWRGIDRKPANKAIGVLTITGNGTINAGDLFSTANGIQFTAIGTTTINGTADINVVAVVAGESGNVGANSIIQMPVTLQGITSCTNANATTDGYNEESDDSLKQRYYDSLQIPPTSGNKYHYLAWAKEVVGVGDAKCIPLWNGNNTVEIIIIDDDKQPADATLVARCQEYIDPLGNDGNPQGNGSGTAPIGAYCTVISATGHTINISFTLVPETGYTIDELKTTITTNINNYLKNIAFKMDYVSFAQIGDVIINTVGVKDYSNLLLNTTASNVDIAENEVAILGTVTANAAS